MKEMKVKKITHNFFWTGSPNQGFGEDYSYCEVGQHGVVKIEYHAAQGDGDRHYCDIIKDDNSVIRVFNLDSITFTKE